MFAPTGWPQEHLADPYPVYRRYREQDSVQRGEGGTWYVFGYDEAYEVLTSPAFGRGPGGPVSDRSPALRRLVQNWLVFMDPPRHTELRDLLQATFSPKVVRALRPCVTAIAAELLAPLQEKPLIDLVRDFAAPFPLLVISELLGVPSERRDWFRERAVWLQGASTSRAGRTGRTGADLAERAARELAAYFSEQARLRARAPREDLLSLLVAAARKGTALSEDEIVGTCVHLLTAGHETTTHLLTKGTLALLRRPGVLRRLRSDPALLPTAVEELVRFDSPVQMVSRWARQDQLLGGKRIRAGEKVVPVLGAANRDPARFPAPDLLRLDRPPARHTGFGLGIHYCLGASLARAEAEIGLAALFAAFPGMTLPSEPPVFDDDLIFHGPTRFPLVTTISHPTTKERPYA
ncbi:cytochrome P450 [Spongiactinospora rosea]|uniref:Cytochrome P450 n=1 Tax=Spongiactinospora rosea TaxID=2248750 RepID=A0A366LQ39_9ACTN|nr:cytochrome P450 [Spongiactinospora rosea]RBQ15302.1 cytochrome P450 [Spongiactinospora rosea]